MAQERSLGYEPRDVSDQKVGYDIESKVCLCHSLRETTLPAGTGFQSLKRELPLERTLAAGF